MQVVGMSGLRGFLCHRGGGGGKLGGHTLGGHTLGGQLYRFRMTK